MGIHSTLRATFAVPELELDESEARELAKAYADVAQYYPALKMRDDVTALMNLGSVVAIVYGSRITAWKMRRKSERMSQHRQQQTQSDLTAAPVNQQPRQEPQGMAPKGPPVTVAEEVRTGEIPGVGAVVFPADHPLVAGKKLQ